MNIPNLSAFIYVSETGSFSKAAERLYITQPAVSKRISSLESELEVKLFDRLNKTVQLTEAGRALLPCCHRILAELEESRRIIANLSRQIGGQLKIGTSHHIGLHRLPPVLSLYQTSYQRVELDLHFLGSEEACEAVLKGELELAITTLPNQPISNLAMQVIWQDPLCIVIGKKHALAKQKQISLKQLLQYPAILPPSNTFTRALLENMLGIKAGDLKIAMETSYLETIKTMVSIGLGWSVLPETLFDKSLMRVDLGKRPLQRQLGVVWHPDRTLSNAARKLMELLEGQSP